MGQTNPLGAYFRATKLWTEIPSNGLYYDKAVIDMPENRELEVLAMTAKDELMLKNPDALLNGEAVAQLIKSCVPAIKQPRKLLKNDVDVLLVAIHGASNGNLSITATCDKCETEIDGEVPAEGLLSSMKSVEEQYEVTASDGLVFVIKPYSFESSTKAGLVQFRSTQNLQQLTEIKDGIDRIKAFSDSIKDLAALEFELLVESVASITIPDTDNGEDQVITNRKHIVEYFENCDKSVGKDVLDKMVEINELGIDRNTEIKCDDCSTEDNPYLFTTQIEINPINFFIAS